MNRRKLFNFIGIGWMNRAVVAYLFDILFKLRMNKVTPKTAGLRMARSVKILSIAEKISLIQTQMLVFDIYALLAKAKAQVRVEMEKKEM